jgi:hypothetical protein
MFDHRVTDLDSRQLHTARLKALPSIADSREKSYKYFLIFKYECTEKTTLEAQGGD